MDISFRTRYNYYNEKKDRFLYSHSILSFFTFDQIRQTYTRILSTNYSALIIGATKS